MPTELSSLTFAVLYFSGVIDGTVNYITALTSLMSFIFSIWN
jgi:hypothetical protein